MMWKSFVLPEGPAFLWVHTIFGFGVHGEKKGAASFFWSRSIKMFLVYAPQDPFRLVGFWTKLDFPLQFKDKRSLRFSRIAPWRLEGKKFTKRNTTWISFGTSTKQCAFSIRKVLNAFKELTGRTFLLIWMLYMNTEFGSILINTFYIKRLLGSLKILRLGAYFLFLKAVKTSAEIMNFQSKAAFHSWSSFFSFKIAINLNSRTVIHEEAVFTIFVD